MKKHGGKSNSGLLGGRGSAFAVVSLLAVVVLITFFVLKKDPLSSAAGSGANGIPSGEGTPTMKAKSVVIRNELRNSEDISMVVRQVQAHLRSLRERIQDRPAAPVVISPNTHKSALEGDPLASAIQGGPGGAAGESDDAPEDQDDTIFVSMAAFRDVECAPTLEDMFRQAKYPHRIFVGIVEQRDATDAYCIPPSFLACQAPQQTTALDNAQQDAPEDFNNSVANLTKRTFCPLDNLRFRRTTPTEARGPTFGRFVAQLMYQGERYFMMIDSHNRFVPRWDIRLLKMYHLLPTKGVISHYPSAYEPGMVMESNHEIMFMCHAHFYDGAGILRNGAKNVRNKQRRPVLQPFTAAGFLFGVSDFVFDVPFDPYLDYLFDGEEILYTVRLWTHGYDSYLPSHDILYHFYGRPKAPKVWGTTPAWGTIQQTSQRRVLYIFNMTKANSTIPAVDPETEPEKRIFMELEKYGLGRERRVEDFWPFAHVDVVKRQSDRGFCDRAN